MDLSLSCFLNQIISNPLLAIAVTLTLGVILVNGWTDAPNAIATCVVTRCMPVRAAIIMAAVFNFLGVLVMSLINNSVSEKITKMVDFGTDYDVAVIALSAALFAIVLWATLAWVFGIPTSESHALIAGLTGSAMAVSSRNGGNIFGGVNGSEWVSVLIGIVVSVVLGFCLGWLVCRGVKIIFRNVERRTTEKIFRVAEIFGAAGMSFMHGAQDGLKFMGVIILAVFFANHQNPALMSEINVAEELMWLMLVCSVVMALGTMLGGKKIIKSVGMDMVKLEKYQGFSADIASTSSLLFCSLTGLPVSTTHAKTTAIIGVGAEKRITAINFSVVKEMVMTWILTFPGCGLVGFVMTKIFLAIFI